MRFLWVGETRQREYRSLETRYLERISRLISCEQQSVSEVRKSDERQVAAGFAKEARSILAKLDDQSYLICLDERGTLMTSKKLAGRVRNFEEQATKELVFLVGGFMGIPPEIEQRSQERWSLSPMTFPHELARLVLLEQAYRALTLVRGLPYHR